LDASQEGFEVASILRHGKDQWRAYIRRVGAPSASKVFDKKSDAQKWAREAEAAIDRGEGVLKAADPELTITLAKDLAFFLSFGIEGGHLPRALLKQNGAAMDRLAEVAEWLARAKRTLPPSLAHILEMRDRENGRQSKASSSTGGTTRRVIPPSDQRDAPPAAPLDGTRSDM
jgi:hypothetical protein